MNDDLKVTEREFADIKAAEYTGKGYKVTRDVPLEFLPGYRADLVVEKDGEFKVIEIKARTSLRTIPALRELERVIDSRPGWSYELQVVAEPEKLPTPELSQWLDEPGIRARLAQADRLATQGAAEAALLIAWAGAEAAARILLADEGVEIDRATDSGYILGIAVANGAISRDDYRSLRGILTHRNAIAHGFDVPGVTSEIVSDLVAVVTKLLQERRGPSERSHARG